MATITVSSVGKISGKFYEGGTNWTLSAASYTGTARPEASPHQGGSRPVATETGGAQLVAPETPDAFTCSNVVAKYTYKAKEKVKGKLKTVTKSVTRTFALTVAPVPVVPDVSVVPEVSEVPIRGVAAMMEAGGSPSSATEIDAWQNLWGSTYKAVGKALFTTKSGKKTLAYKTFTVEVYTNDVGEAAFIQKGAGVAKTGLTYFLTLSLKVTPAGAVTATLTYDTGKKDKKTKKTVYYKPTCSTVVIPTSAADAATFFGKMYLYFAPSTANAFGGYAVVLELFSDGSAFSLGVLRDKVQLWEGGPYWATTNIGAERPEDYGSYFWWGDTVGYKWENEQWVASDGSASGFSFSEDNAQIKTFGKEVVALLSEGWIVNEDGSNVLAPEHDAAQAHWGGGWRMPTKQELDDLQKMCEWNWTMVNGVSGYEVRGKDDYASASIFLPAVGFGRKTSLESFGSGGHYWSSVPYLDYNFSTSYLYFYPGGHRTSYADRYDGKPVRPVQGFTE